MINLKDLSVFEHFLKLCATQIGQLVNYTNLANDCGIDQKTLKSWLSVLNASYIIMELKPHYQNFQKRLTKSRKMYFYDIGLACYLLGITSPEHVKTHPMRGMLFENFIVMEFLKNRFNQVKNNNLYFFRNHVGNEVDLILDYGDQLYSVEIKSSATFNYSYLKGLTYYKKAAGDKNTRQFLIYAGEKSYVTKNTQIFAYRDIEKLFAAINE